MAVVANFNGLVMSSGMRRKNCEFLWIYSFQLEREKVAVNRLNKQPAGFLLMAAKTTTTTTTANCK